jgi:hypothetical protein
VKAAKQAKRFSAPIIEITIGYKETQSVKDANSVASTGVKTFNIFAGLGEHR